MQRTVVIRHENRGLVNVNDEIGLEPYSSYTLKEYLEDQALEEGRIVETVFGKLYWFSDGTTEVLEQHSQRIAVDPLNADTRARGVETAALRNLPQLEAARLLPA